jgi:hypothetical protein
MATTDPQVVELPGIIAKSPRNATQEARWQLYRRLVEQDGLKCEGAAQLCGYTPEYGYQINHKLKARGETVVTMPMRLYRKADLRAAQILDGKPWGTIKEIRDSAVTSVISEIWRRKYPTKVEGAGVQNYSFTKVDLELFRPDNQPLVEPPVGDPVAIIPDMGIAPDPEPPEGTP